MAPDALPASVELPPLEDVPNGAWAWPASIQPRDRLYYTAQYALWQIDPAIDGARMRFVIASLADQQSIHRAGKRLRRPIPARLAATPG